MNRAVISVGSNIRPDENIPLARRRIAKGVKLLAESRFVETEPIGFADQPNFVNGAFLIETEMDLDELRKWLRRVEDELGRVRTANKYGPRTIDLDVVVWNGRIVDDDVYRRDFLRSTVLELLPDLNVDEQGAGSEKEVRP